MSGVFHRWKTDEVWLLPPSVADFVPAGHPAHLMRLGLGQTRFGGHPEAFGRGAPDAEDPPTISARVPPSDDRPGPRWTVFLEDLSREFEPTAQSIGAWVAAADKQEGRREEAMPGWQRRSGSWPGCGVRSAPSSRKPRPGLRERSARCRRALPVHEREPGPLAHRHHGARARRVQGGLPCVGPPAALGSHRCRRGLAETGSGRACDLASDVCGHRASMPIYRPEGSGMAASGSRG